VPSPRLPDLPDLRVLLLDADGNLFPSEEPAFVASVEVTNAFLEAYGAPAGLDPEQLRLATTGKNFRTTAVDLAVAAGVPVHPQLAGRHPAARTATASHEGGRLVLQPAALEHWVAEEKRQVSAHLGRVLRPDPAVSGPLHRLAASYGLAAVSSSASARLEACFTATGLAGLVPADRRWSAEDSLPVPTSKPDPAVYLLAGRELGVAGPEALAVEDSVPGAQSAVAAGFPTVGNVVFVPEAEREERAAALLAVGVATVVASWDELAGLLLGAPVGA
jgi:HAD superfamily hydrolase (TIGR01509 family)